MDKKKIQAITEIVDGKMVAVASDESTDRMGDSLKIKDWDFKNFKKNPVLQAGHDYRPQFTVGVAKNIRIEGARVLFEPVFHSITKLASEIREMYEQGILKAWSVGFMPSDVSESGKNELLEISAVAVPANANALTIAKQMGSADELAIKKEIDEFVIKEIEEKAAARVTTGETDGHTHIATYDDENGIGKTSETEGHFHEIRNFKIQESSGHVHTLDKTEGKEKKADKDKKSPACRMDGESKADCVSRKIPEILNENPEMEQDQAVAIAENTCDTKCSSKEEKPKSKPPKKSIEAWNKTLPLAFHKDFDVADTAEGSVSRTFSLYKKFFDCKVKEIFINSYNIYSPMLGNYLAAFKSVLSAYDLHDTRNYGWSGEEPPIYEVIKLNSKEEEEFLIQGTQFYRAGEKNKFIVEYYPGWSGLTVNIISHIDGKDDNKKILADAHKWVEKNNKLRGEKFALNGEFIGLTDDSWNNTFVEDNIQKSVSNSIKLIKNDSEKSRGMLFLGAPGNGKTKTGRVMMNEISEKTFIWVSAKDFRAVGAVTGLSLGFRMARDLAPTVLFIEDIDSWLNEHGIDVLKSELDGLRQNKGVVTVLTSNFPEELPDALIDRPGRFHDVLKFANPDIKLRKKMIKGFVQEEVKTLDDVVKATEGYSGAYIKELIDFALAIKDDEDLDIDKALKRSLDKIKEQKELVAELKNKKKSVEDLVIEIKEGRIISSKNRKVIQTSIDSLNKTIEVLNDLMTMSEPQKEENKVMEKEVQKKKPKPYPKKINENELMLRALQSIVSSANETLHKAKNSNASA